MQEQDGKKDLIEQVDPNRRDFVRRILGGAFASPVVATFAIDGLTATSAEAQISPNTSPCLTDPGYVGPNVFQSHFFDPTKNTRANGEATFVQNAVPSPHPTREIQTSIIVSSNTLVQNAHIVVNGKDVVNMAVSNGTIKPGDVTNLCDYDELLQAMGAGIATIRVQVTYNSLPFTLTGPIIPMTANVFKINP